MPSGSSFPRLGNEHFFGLQAIIFRGGQVGRPPRFYHQLLRLIIYSLNGQTKSAGAGPSPQPGVKRRAFCFFGHTSSAKQNLADQAVLLLKSSRANYTPEPSPPPARGRWPLVRDLLQGPSAPSPYQSWGRRFSPLCTENRLGTGGRPLDPRSPRYAGPLRRQSAQRASPYSPAMKGESENTADYESSPTGFNSHTGQPGLVLKTLGQSRACFRPIYLWGPAGLHWNTSFQGPCCHGP